MDDLRIGAGADSLVVGFVGIECERVVERDVAPVAGITVSRCGYVPSGAVPNFYVFGMSAFP
jgi:hypothetical protein